jgi:hypothetical protein
MQVDPIVLLVIYCIAVIALGISLYALVVLKDVRDYYKNLYRNQLAQRNTSAGYYSKRK